jgi:hypothetical protein
MITATVNIETGGPAFPGEDVNYPSMTATEKHTGMTLRDYFAAKAMQGFCVSYPDASCVELARAAYAQADSMLEARK